MKISSREIVNSISIPMETFLQDCVEVAKQEIKIKELQEVVNLLTHENVELVRKLNVSEINSALDGIIMDALRTGKC